MENKAVQVMLERIRGNRPEISEAVRQEIYEVNAAAAELHIFASYGEPDLNSPIIAGYRTTWGEKKELCKLEARYAYERGESACHNPYHAFTWSNKWWADSFAQCVELCDRSYHLGTDVAFTCERE